MYPKTIEYYTSVHLNPVPFKVFRCCRLAILVLGETKKDEKTTLVFATVLLLVSRAISGFHDAEMRLKRRRDRSRMPDLFQLADC